MKLYEFFLDKSENIQGDELDEELIEEQRPAESSNIPRGL
eukprot:CAMPEP_0114578608 /NCGR_PEP_ID=MMETSP0125-20121206/3128_1 /TAXON_ID=485358 ORGANISM="Aristerostoma sp., Strain ATCC 50986" /NCGR_SAMPLE_ID=MMETSP0125 /ASSEMBLY_ACC=CAM_ASM_000245 /LENGTH=39 /DNA_ID= /DNA_START= /DNA_END= /DNA_ORIENTATION=